jgi:hypothetical protein
MKIQLDIENNISKKLSIYKIEHDLKTKAEVIREILNKYFKEVQNE